MVGRLMVGNVLGDMLRNTFGARAVGGLASRVLALGRWRNATMDCQVLRLTN